MHGGLHRYEVYTLGILKVRLGKYMGQKEIVSALMGFNEKGRGKSSWNTNTSTNMVGLKSLICAVYST